MIDLDTHVINCLVLAREDCNPRDAALSAAIIAGRHAARLGMHEKEFNIWLKSAYGRVWVKHSNLQPGVDFKEVRKIAMIAYKKEIEGDKYWMNNFVKNSLF